MWNCVLFCVVHCLFYFVCFVCCVCFVLFDLLVLRCRLCFACSWRFSDVITYPYAWTVNFEMRLEGIDSAGDSACNSERISVSTSERISAGTADSNCMSASNSVDICIICRRSKIAHFSLRAPYQNLNLLAPEHQMPIWV